MLLGLSGFELQAWLFVMARLLGWACTDPFMARLPWAMRLLVSGAMAWVWVPALAAPASDALAQPGLLALFLSFLTGMATGFAVRVLIAVSEALLTYLGLSTTFGLSHESNPDQEASLEPVLRALAWWLALLAFFSANGHLMVIKALGESFSAYPPLALPGSDSILTMAEAGSVFLASVFYLALPLLVLILLAQMAFVVLGRMIVGADVFSTGLTLGAFVLLGGLALAAPALVAGLSGLLTGQLPRLLP